MYPGIVQVLGLRIDQQTCVLLLECVSGLSVCFAQNPAQVWGLRALSESIPVSNHYHQFVEWSEIGGGTNQPLLIIKFFLHAMLTCNLHPLWHVVTTSSPVRSLPHQECQFAAMTGGTSIGCCPGRARIVSRTCGTASGRAMGISNG